MGLGNLGDGDRRGRRVRVRSGDVHPLGGTRRGDGGSDEITGLHGDRPGADPDGDPEVQHGAPDGQMVSHGPGQTGPQLARGDPVRSVAEANGQAGGSQHADPVGGTDASLHASDGQSPQDVRRDVVPVGETVGLDVDTGDDVEAGLRRFVSAIEAGCLGGAGAALEAIVRARNALQSERDPSWLLATPARGAPRLVGVLASERQRAPRSPSIPMPPSRLPLTRCDHLHCTPHCTARAQGQF